MYNKQVVQSLWIGKELSIMEQMSIVSFLQNGFDFHLYIYDNVKNIPEGTKVFDANIIISSNKIFKYKERNSYAGFANLFRYKLLFEKGNYWVDTDLVCLKNFDTEDYLFGFARSKTKYPFVYKNIICNGIIKTPVNSDIMKYCFDISTKKNPYDLHWGETGPELITKAVKKFKFQNYIEKANAFCPINWWQWDKLIIKSSSKNILKKAKGIHLWNEMWRRNNIDKNTKFSPNSIYEQLKKKYGF